VFTPVPVPDTVEPEPSLGFDRVIQQAMVHAAVSSARHVDSGSLLVFILQEEESHAAFFLKEQGVDRLRLLRVISHGISEPGQPAQAGGDAPVTQGDPLELYATDLVARAASGGIDPLIGRAAEIERMVQVLCRRRKNNPSLKGWRCVSTRVKYQMS
jgi:ATP-dependent Clp protease ATP-binding subunit ClpA